jgi:hypothetical protein
MATAKWTSIKERSRIYAILLQDLMKRGVCRLGLEMVLPYTKTLCMEVLTPTPFE